MHFPCQSDSKRAWGQRLVSRKGANDQLDTLIVPYRSHLMAPTTGLHTICQHPK